MKYILYARKSSESKEKQALSIQDQIAECKDYAAIQNLHILHTLQESKSAFKPSMREKFDLMIKLLKEDVAEGILTWKPDRLCRNPEEGGKILQLLQDGVIKEIRTATGEVYTQESDHLILQIHFGMANQYSRNLSQNVRRGLKHKARRGEYTKQAPIGFMPTGKPRTRNIAPHLTEGPLMIKAFELAATGKYSLNELCIKLYNMGLRTKKGKRISKSHLHKLLTMNVYYGLFMYAGELYEGNYEPLISKQLFDQVQDALKDRSKPRKHTWDDYHAYNGLIRCGDCGSAITTTVKRKIYQRTHRTAEYIYHHCTHRRGNCHQKAITSQKIEQMLLNNISQIYIDEEVWKLGIKLLKQKHQEETKGYVKQRKHQQNRYGMIQDKLSHLIEMRANEELTREEFLAHKQLLLEEEAKIKNILQDNEVSSHHWLELAENFLETAFKAREIMEKGNPEAKRQLLQDIGQNLILKDKKLDISFKKPYDILLKPSYRTNVLGG